MKQNSFNIAGACAFGALIGSLVALELSARFTYGSYLWIIGALIGGCVAYVTIDFRHFCEGVAQSFRRTISWRPYGLYWRAVGSAFVASAALAPTIATALVVVFLVNASGDGSLSKYTMTDFMTYAMVFVVGLSVAAVPFMMIYNGLLEASRRDKESEEAWAARLIRLIKGNQDFARECNLVAVTIAIACFLLRVIRYCFVHAPAAAIATGSVTRKIGKTIGLFVTRVFVYVHSTRRTICFVDATIGAVIGYYSGSAIIGSVAGAILGVINYEIVSVRWLRLMPASR